MDVALGVRSQAMDLAGRPRPRYPSPLAAPKVSHKCLTFFDWSGWSDH